MGIQAETIEVMSDEDNCQVRRNFKLSACSRLLYADPPKITADQYRLCGAVLADLIQSRGLLSASRLASVPGGGYVVMPRSTNAPVAAQERVPDASWRLGEAKATVGADLAWAIFEDFLLNDHGPWQLEKRWKQRNGTALDTLHMVMDRVLDAEIYDQQKWRTTIWAAGEERA